MIDYYRIHPHYQTYVEKMPDFLDIIRNNKISSIPELEKYTHYSKTQIDGFYHQMDKLKLLNIFDIENGILDINWENVGLWEKYEHSPNWYIYYKSDCIKEKYSKMGLNYDEMDSDDE